VYLMKNVPDDTLSCDEDINGVFMSSNLALPGFNISTTGEIHWKGACA